jgi:FkbM family methyltransferase
MKRIVKALLKKMFWPVVCRYNLIIKKLDYIINKLSLDGDVVELKNARFWVPNAPRDDIQNAQLSAASFYELEMLQSIDRYLTGDSVIVDIGANVGNHTVYWGRISKVKRIYSFEPVKSTFNILSKNIELNNLSDKVKTYNIGLCDRTTKGKIDVYHPDNIGQMSLSEDNDGDIAFDKLDNIDEIMDEDAVDFVKIDVEGSEKKVLLGAINFFNKHAPVVFIESFAGVNQYDFVYDFFKKLNYGEPIKYDGENYLFNDGRTVPGIF